MYRDYARYKTCPLPRFGGYAEFISGMWTAPNSKKTVVNAVYRPLKETALKISAINQLTQENMHGTVIWDRATGVVHSFIYPEELVSVQMTYFCGILNNRMLKKIGVPIKIIKTFDSYNTWVFMLSLEACSFTNEDYRWVNLPPIGFWLDCWQIDVDLDECYRRCADTQAYNLLTLGKYSVELNERVGVRRMGAFFDHMNHYGEWHSEEIKDEIQKRIKEDKYHGRKRKRRRTSGNYRPS